MAHQDPPQLPEIKNKTTHDPTSPLENPVKKYLVPLGVGIVVFGSVTAFAASLTVNSSTLGAGNDTVDTCNTSANVSYTTALSATTHLYEVTGTSVTTVAGTPSACGDMAYKITLLDSSGAAVGSEITGTLGTNTGAATTTGLHLDASSIEGASVVITG